MLLWGIEQKNTWLQKNGKENGYWCVCGGGCDSEWESVSHNISTSSQLLWPKLKIIKPVEYPEVTHLPLNEAKPRVYRSLWARRLAFLVEWVCQRLLLVFNFILCIYVHVCTMMWVYLTRRAILQRSEEDLSSSGAEATRVVVSLAITTSILDFSSPVPPKSSNEIGWFPPES